MKLSVIIPVYNEGGNVAILHKEIVNVVERITEDYEIIFINDGSTDNTYENLKELKPIKIINFRKNFGQTSAFDAGIKEAKGEAIISLDGDCQNDPADIPKLLEQIDKGYDVVSGWRWQRKDKIGKRIISRGAHFLRRFIMNDSIHDPGCSLKAFKKECFRDFNLYGEMHRFIPELLSWKGFKIIEVKVNHRERTSGETKYNLSRTFKGFLDILSVWFWSKYSSRPLHLFGGLGIIFFAIGALLIFVLFVLRFFKVILLAGSIWPLVGFFMMLAGIQLFVFGLLADISLKNYFTVNKSMPYSIKNVISNE